MNLKLNPINLIMMNLMNNLLKAKIIISLSDFYLCKVYLLQY